MALRPPAAERASAPELEEPPCETDPQGYHHFHFRTPRSFRTPLGSSERNPSRACSVHGYQGSGIGRLADPVEVAAPTGPSGAARPAWGGSLSPWQAHAA
ncbi:hypothetical protein Slala04_57260 [Streptomyces lavendulae subsp. lavendulae]|nr:hypothetical protein Slala04_57260 [Streptomyces lavendulae subsp. lavendulae]